MPERSTPRVVIVSNRLPVTVSVDRGKLRVRRSSGGIATGLGGLHEQTGGVWIGWPGNMAEYTTEQSAQVDAELARIGAVPVSLSKSEVEVFYENISNGVLWPLCHDRLDTLPLRVDGWETYETVNARYADAVVKHYRPGDIIWVHDYQLLRLPTLLRERLPEARIGFFLHIPFPNPEIFFALAVRKWLVEGMLGADLIGFHTRRFRGHFTAVMRRLFGVEMGPGDLIAHDGRKIRLGIFPMGVDFDGFVQRSQRPDVATRAAEVKQPGERLLVGIDRLDYSKGIPRRLLAFELLLKRNPDLHGNVRLVQVAVPSRDTVGAYRKFRGEVEAFVGRINGQFGTPRWTPIHYIYRSIPEALLLALYRAADVMLVTPMRDGMNLVAKEFVAARTDEDGVLVLSEFAGAADELQEALIVNPYDVDGTADAIGRALDMPRAERRARMQVLRGVVAENNVFAWAEKFLSALDERRVTPARGLRSPRELLGGEVR